MIHPAPYAPFSLSLTDSTRLKGVALLLLLWHHLFYMGGTQYTEWHVAGIPVIQQTGLAAKVCVALFVLLSGYGLAVQATHKPMGYGMFLRKRLKKLFINYWVMWLLFVPIGFLFFGWTLQGIYGNHAVVKLLVNFLGLQYVFGYFGLNPTWWFYSLIILLYLLFPLLYRLAASRRGALGLWVFSGIYMVAPLVPDVAALKVYLVCFITGVVWARHFSGLMVENITPP